MALSIRHRIVAVFAVFFAFFCVLTIFYWWNVSSIRGRLLIAEDFEDLFNNILEARRYEKNFLFYRDPDSLNENIVFIKKVSELAHQLSSDMVRVIGQKEFVQFQNDLNQYQAMMEQYVSGNPAAVPETQAEEVRSKGKAIVDFANNLLKVKRHRIHQALTGTLALPFVFLGILIILLVLVIQMLSKKVLKPLALIHRTIGQVAEGDYNPIHYEAHEKDEISQLIDAFNKMARELETKQEQLLQSRKIAALGTFTAGIAHELNNPINNIYLTAETLLEDYESLSKPESKELVLDVLNQAERAAEIVKNLLDFSRSDLPSLATLKIKDVIEKTLKLVKNQVMLTGVKVSLSIPEELPLINGNFRNLEQVFLNLFINAIQAMPNGGMLAIEAFQEINGYIRVDVQDNGSGIKSEQLEHIFEPFYTTKSVGRGTGLGLAVSYSLVKKHGGYIEVQSQVNVGTVFSIYLPVESANGAVEGRD